MHATADLYDKYGDQLQVVKPALKRFGKRSSFAGRIITIRLFEDNSFVRSTLENDGKGKVLVVDGGGSLQCALVGDLIAKLAIDNGWEGMIINGCIRDSAIINSMPIGIFALATNPRKSQKNNKGELNTPVNFLDVEFRPGEWLVADEDGIVVHPSTL